MPRGPKKLSMSSASIDSTDEFLTTREAAALTKLSVAWFERAPWERSGPPYLKCGRAVRYLKAELLQWWAGRRVDPTKRTLPTDSRGLDPGADL